MAVGQKSERTQRIFVPHAPRNGASLRYLYESRDNCDFWVMLFKVVNGRALDDCWHEEATELPYLFEESEDQACIVWRDGKSEETSERGWTHNAWIKSYFNDVEKYRNHTINVTWVTQPSGNFHGETMSTDLGNEEIYYYKVCIIVDVTHVPCPRAE